MRQAERRADVTYLFAGVRVLATPAAALTLMMMLSGCPGSRGGSPPGQTTASAPGFVDEVAVLQADASTAPVQSALATLALDKSQRATKRLAALRKLEEVQAPPTVPVAEALAEDASRSQDADFLRENATGLLVRARSDESKAALTRVKASSFDAAVLAARLERLQGGH